MADNGDSNDEEDFNSFILPTDLDDADEIITDDEESQLGPMPQGAASQESDVIGGNGQIPSEDMLQEAGEQTVGETTELTREDSDGGSEDNTTGLTDAPAAKPLWFKGPEDWKEVQKKERAFQFVCPNPGRKEVRVMYAGALGGVVRYVILSDSHLSRAWLRPDQNESEGSKKMKEGTLFVYVPGHYVRLMSLLPNLIYAITTRFPSLQDASYGQVTWYFSMGYDSKHDLDKYSESLVDVMEGFNNFAVNIERPWEMQFVELPYLSKALADTCARNVLHRLVNLKLNTNPPVELWTCLVAGSSNGRPVKFKGHVVAKIKTPLHCSDGYHYSVGTYQDMREYLAAYLTGGLDHGGREDIDRLHALLADGVKFVIPWCTTLGIKESEFFRVKATALSKFMSDPMNPRWHSEYSQTTLCRPRFSGLQALSDGLSFGLTSMSQPGPNSAAKIVETGAPQAQETGSSTSSPTIGSARDQSTVDQATVSSLAEPELPRIPTTRNAKRRRAKKAAKRQPQGQSVTIDQARVVGLSSSVTSTHSGSCSRQPHTWSRSRSSTRWEGNRHRSPNYRSSNRRSRSRSHERSQRYMKY